MQRVKPPEMRDVVGWVAYDDYDGLAMCGAAPGQQSERVTGNLL
jgi:hypothetical protein